MVTIDGRQAVVNRQPDGAGCLGAGADESVDYGIDIGQNEGAVALSPRADTVGLAICWRGRAALIAPQITSMVKSIGIETDPTNRGPFPN